MEYCVFICQKYSYTTFSPFYDGNPSFLYHIYLQLVSFFRKVEEKASLRVYFNSADLLGSIDVDKEFGEVEDIVDGIAHEMKNKKINMRVSTNKAKK